MMKKGIRKKQKPEPTRHQSYFHYVHDLMDANFKLQRDLKQSGEALKQANIGYRKMQQMYADCLAKKLHPYVDRMYLHMAEEAAKHIFKEYTSDLLQQFKTKYGRSPSLSEFSDFVKMMQRKEYGDRAVVTVEDHPQYTATQIHQMRFYFAPKVLNQAVALSADVVTGIKPWGLV